MPTTLPSTTTLALLAEDDQVEALERAAARRRAFLAIWHACAS